METTLGILLAGGAGRRLDPGRPKPLVRLAGRTLLERAAATLAAACDVVVVAAPASVALPATGMRRVEDAGDGPLAGLVAGLAAADAACALVLGVDFPLVDAAWLAALRDALGPALAAVPAPGGIPQPLVAAYAPGARTPLEAAYRAGVRSPSAALEALAPRLLDDRSLDAFPGGSSALLNVNLPEDLALAERALAARARERAS